MYEEVFILSLRGILRGLIVSVLMTVFFLLLISVILYFSNISEKYLNVAVYVLTALSVVTGSVICAKISESKILLNCLCCSALFLLALIALSLIKNANIYFNMHFLIMSVSVFVCGILGAIIGK